MDSQNAAGRAGFKTPARPGQVTVAEMANVRQDGYDDGYKEGQAAGYKAGFESGQADLHKKMELELTKIRQLIQAMQHPFQDFRNELVSEMKVITRELCETFLRHTMVCDQSLLEHLVDEALGQLLPTDHQVVIHVNSHNSEVVQKALKNHLEDDSWRLQLNEKLSDGNVFLESGHSRVTLDLEALLKNYLQQLK